MKSQIVIVFEHQQDDTPVNLAAGIDRLLRTVEAESSKNGWENGIKVISCTNSEHWDNKIT